MSYKEKIDAARQEAFIIQINNTDLKEIAEMHDVYGISFHIENGRIVGDFIEKTLNNSIPDLKNFKMPDLQKMSFGKRLRYIRKFCSVRQSDLAEAIGTSGVMISRYENDKDMPDTNRSIKIANYLNVSMDLLCLGVLPDGNKL